MQSLSLPQVAAAEVAWISQRDMIEVDRVMMEDLQISLMQMMENAGRALAIVVRSLSGADRVTVMAGSGGNGGGGMVAARHLSNSGLDVAVMTTRSRDDMSPAAAHQFGILERMGVPLVTEIRSTDLIVDAIIGYTLQGAPRGSSAHLIEAAATAPIVVSLDTPSGLNVTDGSAPGIVVQADSTVTLALPKTGLRTNPCVGELYLADISVPPSVTSRFGSPPPVFGELGLLRIRR